MANPRSLLSQVRQLKAAQQPRPFPYDIAQMEAEADGKDSSEWPLVIRALRRWKDEGYYDQWYRGDNRVWQR